MRLDGHITIREKSVLSAPRGFFLLTKTGMSVVGISDQFNINTYFSFRAKCCFKGGVGGHFPRGYLYLMLNVIACLPF